MVGITDDPRILIFRWFETLRDQCRVSLGSEELCSGQLRPSEWCTLRWIIKYVTSDLLAAS